MLCSVSSSVRVAENQPTRTQTSHLICFEMQGFRRQEPLPQNCFWKHRISKPQGIIIPSFQNQHEEQHAGRILWEEAMRVFQSYLRKATSCTEGSLLLEDYSHNACVYSACFARLRPWCKCEFQLIHSNTDHLPDPTSNPLLCHLNFTVNT